jgi:hypothetical protein
MLAIWLIENTKQYYFMRRFLVIVIMTLVVAHYAVGGTTDGQYVVRFGIIECNETDGCYLSKETSEIPFKVRDTGFRFGFEIIPPNSESYTCRYMVHLPSPPAAITGGLKDVNPGKPSNMIKSHLKHVAGVKYVDPMWFDVGDPKGDCTIDIFINEKLSRTINFKVKESTN